MHHDINFGTMLWVLPALDSWQQTWLDTPEYITDVMENTSLMELSSHFSNEVENVYP